MIRLLYSRVDIVIRVRFIMGACGYNSFRSIFLEFVSDSRKMIILAFEARDSFFSTEHIARSRSFN